jgi:hypothetical protein
MTVDELNKMSKDFYDNFHTRSLEENIKKANEVAENVGEPNKGWVLMLFLFLIRFGRGEKNE